MRREGQEDQPACLLPALVAAWLADLWLVVVRYMRDKTTPRPLRTNDLRIAFVSRQQVPPTTYHLPRCRLRSPPARRSGLTPRPPPPGGVWLYL